MDKFFPGFHQPSDVKHFPRGFVSVERLWNRKGPFQVGEDGDGEWGMDCGSFGRLIRGKGHRPVAEYAAQIRKWSGNANLLFAVSQDYMCEPQILALTGLDIPTHQRLTIERYDALLAEDTAGVYIMPVLQGYAPDDYVDHIAQYGQRLAQGAWVGVGSVCKRNGSATQILSVLMAIKMARPDLRLHGFGLKITALQNGLIRSLIYSADSMAWSFAARKNKTGANDWRNAWKFAERIKVRSEYQGHFLELVTEC